MGREDARHKRAHAALRCARWLALAALAALAVTACAIAAAAAGAALSDGGGGGGAATAPEASHPAAGGGRAAALRRGAVGVASDASLAITSGGASPPPLASPGQQSYRCAPKPPPALLAWGEETPLVFRPSGFDAGITLDLTTSRVVHTFWWEGQQDMIDTSKQAKRGATQVRRPPTPLHQHQ